MFFALMSTYIFIRLWNITIFKLFHRYAFDMAEIGNQLLKMACDPHNASEWSADGSQIWEDTKRGFGAISKYVRPTLSYLIDATNPLCFQ